MLNPNKTISFEGMTLYEATNKELTSKNKKTIPENTLHFYCSPDAVIDKGTYICSDVKIMDKAHICSGVYLGQGVIIRDYVIVPQGMIVSATPTNKIHNKTAEQVAEYVKD